MCVFHFKHLFLLKVWDYSFYIPDSVVINKSEWHNACRSQIGKIMDFPRFYWGQKMDRDKWKGRKW